MPDQDALLRLQPPYPCSPSTLGSDGFLFPGSTRTSGRDCLTCDGIGAVAAAYSYVLVPRGIADRASHN